MQQLPVGACNMVVITNFPISVRIPPRTLFTYCTCFVFSFLLFSQLEPIKKKAEEEEKKQKGGKVERWKNLHFVFDSYVFLLHFLKSIINASNTAVFTAYLCHLRYIFPEFPH